MKTPERNCHGCPAFYECKEDGISATGGGFQTKEINGEDVVCVRPGTRLGIKRTMDRFCFYCLATPNGKKIGSKASWSGSTPRWCPLRPENKKEEAK